ncbi:hypothetical protein DFH11DRAFT_927176 [Phellopilus nigrolimitatus]|nr:hypothetical protein DFH11DRAFT_927176 [Phellopilus nigrolimitatus]
MTPTDTGTRSITVLYFAAALTATRIPSETVMLPSGEFRLSALSALLAARHQGTNLDAVLRTSQWSVDAEMVDEPEGVVLKGGEEVAVICPVSGG